MLISDLKLNLRVCVVLPPSGTGSEGGEILCGNYMDYLDGSVAAKLRRVALAASWGGWYGWAQSVQDASANRGNG